MVGMPGVARAACGMESASRRCDSIVERRPDGGDEGVVRVESREHTFAKPDGSECVVARTGGGSAPTWALHALARIPNVKLVVCDANPLSVGFSIADARAVIPLAQDPAFVDRMLDVCREQRVDVLLPAVDEEIPLLGAARERFAAFGTTVLLSPQHALETCQDKAAFARFLTRHDIPAPRSWLPDEAPRAAYPWIVKPRAGRGSTNVWKIENDAQRDFFTPRTPNPILQEFAPGVECTVDTLSDLDGRFLYGSPRIRLATDSGISISGEVVADDDAMALVARLLDTLGVVGPANVQYIRPDERTVLLLEINPRLSGGGALTEGAGIPYIEDVLRVAFGLPVPVRRPVVGTRMLRQWSEVFLAPGSAY